MGDGQFRLNVELISQIELSWNCFDNSFIRRYK